MDGAVGSIAAPCALDIAVSGIVADDEGEHAVDAALILHHVELLQGDVAVDALLGAVSGNPLHHVALCAHGGAGDGVDLTGAGQVVISCYANHTAHSSSSSVRR